MSRTPFINDNHCTLTDKALTAFLLIFTILPIVFNALKHHAPPSNPFISFNIWIFLFTHVKASNCRIGKFISFGIGHISSGILPLLVLDICS